MNNLARYHLNKLEGGGLRSWFEQEMAQVMAHIKDFPTTLALHEQSLFALGYYHQVADYRRQSIERADHHDDEHPKQI